MFNKPVFLAIALSLCANAIATWTRSAKAEAESDFRAIRSDVSDRQLKVMATATTLPYIQGNVNELAYDTRALANGGDGCNNKSYVTNLAAIASR
jgi:hypothetical protein